MKRSLIKKSVFVLVLLALISIGLSKTVLASPSFKANSAKTSTATTTLLYMTPGTATTTVTYDSKETAGTNQTNGGNTYLPNSALLKIWLKASSTATVLVTNIEYSDDAIDWYQDNLSTFAAGAIAIATPNSFTWTYASTTVGGAGVVATTDTGQKAILLKTPSRYIRAVLSVTGKNGAVYAEIAPTKEISNF